MLGLYNLSSKLTIAKSYEELYDIFSSALKKILKFDNFALLIKEGDELKIVKKLGIYEPNTTLNINGTKGITVACAREKKKIYVPDVTKDTRYIEAAPGIKSEVAIPILYGNELIGVIDVEKAEVGGFEEEDIKLLEIFANVLAASFKNVEFKKELEGSERKYRSLIENIGIGIYRNTPGVKGKFIEVNPAIIKMFGYKSKEEFMKINVSDLYQNPEDRKKINEKLLKKGFIKNEIIKLKKKNGKSIVASVTAVAVKDERGRVKYFDGIVEDITERIKTEEALKKSEEKYKNLVEYVPCIICKLKPDGITIFVNSYVKKITGYEPDEIVGKNWWGIFYPGELEKQIDELYEKFNEGDVADYEMKLMDKYGEIHTISWNSFNVWSENGELVEINGVGIDITERKKIENELRKSEERYRNLFEEIKDAFYISTIDGKFVEVNKAMVELLGYKSKRELLKIDIGKDFYYKPDAREKLLKVMAKDGYIKDYEVEVKRKDGKKLIVLETSRERKDENGKVIGYEGIIRDITEQKMMQEELRKSERKFRSIFENAVEGIYRLDKRGRLIEANKALENFFGYSEEELRKMDLNKLYKNPKKRSEFLKELKEKGFLKNLEIEYVRKDGSIVIGNEYAILVKEGRKEYIDGIIHDITELKKAQREAEFYNALLRHDVANKLQLVIGYIDMLLNEEISGEQRELAELALKSALSASRIIENVRRLQILKKEIKKKKFSIDEMIEGILKEYSGDLEKRDIEVVSKSYGKKIIATEFLGEAISNIIGNSISHSGASKIEIKVEEDGNYVKICVEDNGIGITDDVKEKIFKMGYKGEESRGSGLGLYLAKKIVENMGGKIKVKDRVKEDHTKGVAFEIYIPK